MSAWVERSEMLMPLGFVPPSGSLNPDARRIPTYENEHGFTRDDLDWLNFHYDLASRWRTR